MSPARCLLAAALGAAACLAMAPAPRAQAADPTAQVSAARTPRAAHGPMLVASPDGERLLAEGRAALLAFRLDEAEATFRRLGEAPGARPAAAYHLMTVALWRALMTEREPYYGRFFARADTLADLAAALPESPWKGYFRAEAALQRAVVLAKQERMAQAGLALKSAFGGYEATARAYPDFEEAYKGLGLAHVAVGAVPRSYRFLLRVFGFSGTVPQGMAELERAATASAYAREEAALFLAVVDAALNEHKAGAIAHVRRLHEAHPESPMTAYLYAYLLLDARRAAEAEALLRSAAELQRRPGVDEVPYVDYYLADALFRQNRFDEAAPLYERYLRTYRGRALLAQAALNGGLAREMMGDRDAAEALYARVRGERDLDSDQAARREAARLLRAPMTAAERDLLRGRTLYDGGQYREAIAVLQPLLLSDIEVHRAEAAYRSGRAYQALEAWDEALRHYGIAADRPGDPLAKWGPWSQYYVGEVYEETGRADEARAAYRAALANEQPFDYHKGLEQRARTALARLR